MSQNEKSQSSIKLNYTGLCMAIGLVLGGIVGYFVGNMVIFAGGGLVIGLALGTALDKRGK